MENQWFSKFLDINKEELYASTLDLVFKEKDILLVL